MLEHRSENAALCCDKIIIKHHLSISTCHNSTRLLVIKHHIHMYTYTHVIKNLRYTYVDRGEYGEYFEIGVKFGVVCVPCNNADNTLKIALCSIYTSCYLVVLYNMLYTT